MSQMYVREPAPVVHILDEWDFTLANGTLITFTVDKDAGDTMTTEGNLIHIHLVPKVSLLDPSVMNPAEDVVINQRHVAIMFHRVKEVQTLTADERVDWLKTLEDVSGTVQ